MGGPYIVEWEQRSLCIQPRRIARGICNFCPGSVEYLRDADIFGIRYKSSTEQIDFDCLNKQFRFYDLTVYTGNSLTGDRRSVTSRGRQWNPYASGAQFAEVGDAVCSHAASKPNEPSEP